jgi:hypothetical protein
MPIENAQIGDIVQLNFDSNIFGHSLFVVTSFPEILVAAHSNDADYRPLADYSYVFARLIHIDGVRD